MKEQLLTLISLQECDLQLVKLSAKKIKLPEMICKMDEDFQIFKESAEQNKRKLADVKAQRAECEANVQKINDGMLKTRQRLLEVKNNKEYQAMLKEMETGEKTRGDIETKIIALMEEMEKLAILAKQDDETIAQAAAKYEEEKKMMQDELNAVDADALKLMEKKAELQKDIPESLLMRYEKIRKRNNGVGITSVWKAVCNGCHMNIPPQLYNELQRTNDLLSCPNCSRIMYFDNQKKSA